MVRKFKNVLYLLICLVILFVFLKISDNSLPTNSATAFEWEKQVQVYFGNLKKGSSEDCSKVFPVSRTILNAETFGPGALEVLLRGVSVGEEKAGYFSSINNGVLIQKFEVKNGVAYVDFNSRFNQGMGGSCRVSSIRAQIEKTLIDLPDIDSVVISVNGETEGILEP